MVLRLIFLVLSVGVLIASQTGHAAPALVIPAALSVLVFLFLALRWSSEQPGRRRLGTKRQIIVDGSNVMYWKDGEPRLDSVIEVLARLETLGFSPGVIFDANAGYLMTGKHKNHVAMSRLLGLPRHRVMVVPRGTPADRLILQAAGDLGVGVVTNDRFRDWIGDFPKIAEPGFLIQGRYQQGELKLMADAKAMAGVS